MGGNVCVLCLLGLLAGCSKKENTNEEQGTSPTLGSEAGGQPATPIDPATAASVSGTVTFGGTAPKGQKIDMSQDAACKGSNMAETIVANDGKLANVFVYVKEGLGNRTFDVPKDAVTIDQKGCQYHPHVLGVMTGQNIEIKQRRRHHAQYPPHAERQSRVERVAATQGRAHREELRPRRNHAAGEVQPASLDEDVCQRGEEPRSMPSPARMASTRSKACRRAITRWHLSRKSWASRRRKSRWPPKTARP